MSLNRRHFNRLLTSIGLAPAFAGLTAEGAISGGNSRLRDPEILRLSRNDWMPNNEQLPVLLYHGVLHGRGDDPAAPSKRSSRGMAGHRSGATACTTIITTTRRRTKSWALWRDRRG